MVQATRGLAGSLSGLRVRIPRARRAYAVSYRSHKRVFELVFERRRQHTYLQSAPQQFATRIYVHIRVPSLPSINIGAAGRTSLILASSIGVPAPHTHIPGGSASSHGTCSGRRRLLARQSLRAHRRVDEEAA